MTGTLWPALAGILVLLVVSFFFSLSETSLTTASRARIHVLAQSGDKSAKRIEALLAVRERLLGTILLGNNIVNIAASTLAASVLLHLFGDAGILYATIVMTALIVVFTEVLPKTLALTRPEPMALFVAPPLRVLVAALAPITLAIQAVVDLIARLLGFHAARADEMSGHEELRGAVALLHAEGEVGEDDREMLGGILDLKDLTVSDVMVHRTRMMVLDIDMPAAELVRAMLEAPHTRIPLYEGAQDNIVGVLHAKDLLRAYAAARGEAGGVDVRAVMSAPWFVPESMPVRTQLAQFLHRRRRMALVLDEYGVVEGLVTLEDILEEIVGDIADEHDAPGEEVLAGIRPHPEGGYVIDAGLAIRDVNRALDWSLPDEDANTLAGLVINAARAIPVIGQEVEAHGFTFKVVGRQRQRVTRVTVRPAPRA